MTKTIDFYHPTWEIFDSSKIQTFMDCPRKYFYQYILGWNMDIPNHDLIFGAAFHEGMEVLTLNPGDVDGAHDAFLDYYRQYFSPETDDIYRPKTPDAALMAFAHYISRYQGQDRFTPLYTELGGRVFTGKHHIVYKIDAVCKDENDHIFALEHKTTKNGIRQVWLDEFLLSLQIGTYSYALRCIYPNIAPIVIVNGVSFSKTKVDMIRQPVKKTRHQLNIWSLTINFWIDQMKEEIDIFLNQSPEDEYLKAFPLNTRACTNYFRLCPFHDFCMAWANPAKQACDGPPEGFTTRYWNPLEELTIKTEINLEAQDA